MPESPLPELNLPAIDPRRLRGEEIFDRLRRKWVALTPEEWVRQHFVDFLINAGFPESLMANEVGISLNNTRRRCDTVIYTRTLTPWAIVEYKRPSVQITQKVFDQIMRYNLVLGVPYLIVSNGLRHFAIANTPDGPKFMDALPPCPDA